MLDSRPGALRLIEGVGVPRARRYSPSKAFAAGIAWARNCGDEETIAAAAALARCYERPLLPKLAELLVGGNLKALSIRIGIAPKHLTESSVFLFAGGANVIRTNPRSGDVPLRRRRRRRAVR